MGRSNNFTYFKQDEYGQKWNFDMIEHAYIKYYTITYIMKLKSNIKHAHQKVYLD